VRDAFQGFDQLCNAIVIVARGEPERSRFDHKGSWDYSRGLQESRTQAAIYDGLEGIPRAADFRAKEPGHIVIESKSGSHIVMLSGRTSRCQGVV